MGFEIEEEEGIMTTEVDSYEELTVDELREELKARDLPGGGNKAELVERLEANDRGEKVVGPGTGVGPGSRAGAEATQSAQIASTNQEVAELKAEAKQNTADVHDILPRLTAIEERLSNAGI